jgi:hypothetical protein
MKSILPWIPIFGGIYCQNFATVYFRNVELQIANFIYHMGILLILMIVL